MVKPKTLGICLFNNVLIIMKTVAISDSNAQAPISIRLITITNH